LNYIITYMVMNVQTILTFLMGTNQVVGVSDQVLYARDNISECGQAHGHLISLLGANAGN